MSQLFDRYIEVQIDNIILPKELRYKFDISKSLLPEPNICNIDIYNLSPDRRGSIKKATIIDSQKSGSVISIKAGYKNLYEQIFIGEIVNISHEKQDADIISKIKLGDGFSSINFTELEKAFRAGVSLKQVISDVYGSMNLSGKNTATVDNDLSSKKFDTSYVISGKAKLTLDDISKQINASWSVQDLKLLILKNGQAINQTNAVKINVDTGLIGSPSRTEKGINFKSLLNPKLKPGYVAQLTSSDFNAANILIQRVKYTGDTKDLLWYAECEGQEI